MRKHDFFFSLNENKQQVSRHRKEIRPISVCMYNNKQLISKASFYIDVTKKNIIQNTRSFSDWLFIGLDF